MELIGRIERVPIGGPDAEHADGPARRLERQVERGGAGQGGGAESRGLMVLVHPLGHAELVRVERELTLTPGHQALAAGAGQEHDDLAPEDLADVSHRDRQELVQAACSRARGSSRRRRRPLLALAGGLRLQADPRGRLLVTSPTTSITRR